MKSKRWFVAESLILYVVREANSLLLHDNFILIEAPSVTDAIALAMVRGREQEDKYTNTNGHTVESRFLGLRNVHPVYGSPEDGAEIPYERCPVSSVAEAQKLVRNAEHFNAFPSQGAPRWFLAEILILDKLMETECLVLQNTFVLIEAKSPGDAIRSALARGRAHDHKGINDAGRTIESRFLGLRDVHQVYDDPGDGSEILYMEFQVSSISEAENFVQILA